MPDSTLWPAEPHTVAKHAIVRGYLGAWFGILPAGFKKVVYFDGFAGPGRYVGGELGSPLVALEAAREHAAKNPGAKFLFTLVEKDAPRAENLRAEIGRLGLPANVLVEVVCGEFDAELRARLDTLDRDGAQNAPIFAFVDPFGVDGFPFELIERLLARPRTEVLITFMTNYVKRFADKWPEKLPAVLGSDATAAEVRAIADPKRRLERIRGAYATALGRAAKFVRYFTMQDKTGNTIYDLFFAGQHPLGHVKMKEAMRAVGQGGEYTFCDGVDAEQMALFGEQIPAQLAKLIAARFNGQIVDASVVKRFTENETPFVAKDFTAAMKALEGGAVVDGSLTVSPLKADGAKRKKDTFPAGVQLKFGAAPSGMAS